MIVDISLLSGEWISGAVCMYIAERLIKDYKVTKKDTHLLEKLEIVLVPFVNPDGYVVSVICLACVYEGVVLFRATKVALRMLLVKYSMDFLT